MGIPSLIPNIGTPQAFEPSSNPFQTEGVVFQNTLLGLKSLHSEEGSNEFLVPDFGLKDSENLLMPKKNSEKDLELLNGLPLPTVFTAESSPLLPSQEKTLNAVDKPVLNNLFAVANVEPQSKPAPEAVKGNEFFKYDVNAFSFESTQAPKDFDSSSVLQTWSVFQAPQSSSLSKEKGIENYSQVAQGEKPQGELNRVNTVSESNAKFLGNDLARGEGNETPSLNAKKLSKELVLSKESTKQEVLGRVAFENKPNWFQNKEVTEPQSNSSSIAPFKTSEVATQVQTLAAEGGGKMQVLLTPPHLGQVEIQVLTKGKKVELGIRLEDAASKSMVEQGLQDLKQALEHQNLQLSKVEISEGEVSIGSNLSQGLNFSEHERSGQSGFFQGNESPRRQILGAGLDRNRGSEEVVRPSYASTPSTGRLNLKV